MLKHIKTTKCPVCSCQDIINEDIEVTNNEIRYHVNGERWETRKFSCGFSIKYIPNFSQERILSFCYQSNENKKIIELREQLNELQEQEREINTEISNLYRKLC